MTGYLHGSYAASFEEHGKPQFLNHCRGWIVKRPVSEILHSDAMGCYPFFCCENWDELGHDLEKLCSDLVCLSLVTDPFTNCTIEQLQTYFPDVAIPFKEHFIVELDKEPVQFVHSHHQRNAAKALQSVSVEVCEDPLQYLDEWCSLYAELVERHHITGLTAFSRAAFEKQLGVPGLVMLRAVHEQSTIGLILWYTQGTIAYYHLAAYSETGYDLRASFALFWRSIEYFTERGFQYLGLGAGAGVDADGSDGLTRFKRGWSTGTRPVYFCGRIFNHDLYQKLTQDAGNSETRYFPAYRSGEFS